MSYYKCSIVAIGFAFASSYALSSNMNQAGIFSKIINKNTRAAPPITTEQTGSYHTNDWLPTVNVTDTGVFLMDNFVGVIKNPIYNQIGRPAAGGQPGSGELHNSGYIGFSDKNFDGSKTQAVFSAKFLEIK